MSNGERVLVVGWDGATFDLLDSLVAQGLMPNLSRMMREGYRSTLLSTMPPISAPAWTTLITGVNPGRHGILNFVETDAMDAEAHAPQGGAPMEVFPGGYSVINATQIQAPTLWQRLTAAGKQIGVINMPMTYPPEPVDGFIISGMLTPPGASDYTYPPGLRAKLDDYEIELELSEREFDFPAAQLIARATEIAGKRGRTALRLMQERPWDTLFVVFTGTDRLQHRFWDALAPRSPTEDGPAAVGELPGLLRSYYKLLDTLLGELMSAAGHDALIIVMSDHGFGPIGSRSVHRRALARALGLESEGKQGLPVRIRSLAEARLGLTWPRLRRLLARTVPRNWLQRLERTLRSQEKDSQRKDLATIVPFVGHIGGIHINRPRLGDRSVADFRNRLAEDLQGLRDPHTGEHLVADVWPREALYHGELANRCPDLVFALNPAYVLAGGVGRDGGLVGPRTSHPLLQGSHRRDGILVMAGPGVRPGRSSQAHRIEDVTATIMALQRLPLPKTLDGRPVEDAFEALEWRFATEGEAEHLLAEYSADDAWSSPEEMSAVVERLRGIGYVE
jgi:predicted AlkP superfamily phosphohydrolase/phosphomutase